MISTPRPITLELKQLAKNVWLHEAEPDGAWPFSYIVARGLEDKDGTPFTSNLSNGTNHQTAKNALGEVQSHFAQCVSRCYVSIPARPLIEMARRKTTSDSHGQALDALAERLEGEDARAALVMPLPFQETGSGNQVTHGGSGFPWPFAYLITRVDDEKWVIHGHEEDGEMTYDDAAARADEIHDDRIGQLIVGMTARALTRSLETLTLDEVEVLARRVLGEPQVAEMEMEITP